MSDKSVKPSELVILLERCFAAARPAMIWAQPGVGKSDIIQQLGDKHNRPVIDMRLLLCEPTDLKGIPFYSPETQTMMWAQPNDLPKNVTADQVAKAELVLGINQKRLALFTKANGKDIVKYSPELFDEYEALTKRVEDSQTNYDNAKRSNYLSKAILFLDELNSAPPSVQAAAYQLMLNRRIGEYHLPKGVSIVCAGNRDTDRGVTYRMPSPLANRMIHLNLEVNFKDWQSWAIENGIHPDVVGFLTHHTQHLNTFDPKSPDKAFATPRSWFFVSQLLDDDMPEHLMTALVAGTVGEGLAIEFQQHRRVSAKMPSPESILKGENPKLSIKEVSALYSLTVSMCYMLKEWYKRVDDPSDKFGDEEWHKTIDHFLKFMMDNFQAEMTVLGTKTALRDFQLQFDHRKLATFSEVYKRYGQHILNNE